MSELKQHYLYPGAIFIDPEPHLITTVLGSCVSICLWNHVLKIGGINHYQMDLWNGLNEPSNKYGDIAIRNLINKMIELGSRKFDISAKVFGGAAVISTGQDSMNIGEKNIRIAKSLLESEGIPIVSSNVGGYLGRKIKFYSATGLVLMKKIQKSDRMN